MMFPRVFFGADGTGGGAPAADAGGSTIQGTPQPTGFGAVDAAFDKMSDDDFQNMLSSGKTPEPSNAGTPDAAAAAAAGKPPPPPKTKYTLKNGTIVERTAEELAEIDERDQSRGRHWQQTAVEQIKQARAEAKAEYDKIAGAEITALKGQISQLLEHFKNGVPPQGRADPAASGTDGGGEGKTAIDILYERISKGMEETVARHLAPMQEAAWTSATDALENATTSYEGDREDLISDLHSYGVVFDEQGKIDVEKNTPAKIERACRMASKQREIDNRNTLQYTDWRDTAVKEYPEGTFDPDDLATIAGLVLQAVKGDKANNIPRQKPTALMFKDITRAVYDKNVGRASKLAATLRKQRESAAGKKADLKTVPATGEPADTGQGKPKNPWDEAEKKIDAQFQQG